MLVTKKEANKKWCPAPNNTIKDSVCCGSDCMAWRWYRFLADHPKPTPKGYCGLAGKTEVVHNP